MRLIEVIMLMGAHCVSPVEHSALVTDATKVQCAVVMEKDTDKGTLTVTPPAAVADPQVAAAVLRLGNGPDAGTRIVPARAPAGSPAVEVKPAPVAKPSVPPPIAPPETILDPAPPAAAAAPVTPAAEATAKPEAQPEAKPEQKIASIATPPKRATARAAAAPKKAKPAAARKPVQCKGSAVAKWYTTADGHRRFRCVGAGTAARPAQLY